MRSAPSRSPRRRLLFALNAAVTGEFNYQAGDRKTFIDRFPFDRPDATWQSFPQQVIDDPGQAAQAVLINRRLPARFARNVEYFLLGRHFGFIPYYFPGFVAIVAWLVSRSRRDDWRIVTFAGFLLACVLLLLVLPFTWSGGGGPPGNRYALSAYPVLLFLMPPMASAWTGTARVAGWRALHGEDARQPVRRRQVHLGAVRARDAEAAAGRIADVARLAGRARAADAIADSVRRPGPPAVVPRSERVAARAARHVDIRVAGAAEIILRAERPVRPSGGRSRVADPDHGYRLARAATEVSTVLEPRKVATFTVPAGSPVPGRYGDSVYLMTTHSSDGFVPHLVDGSADYRNLGALLRFRAVLK